MKRLSNDSDSKRYRATFDKAQIFHMERVFLINHYPDVTARSELSKATGLSESQVQVIENLLRAFVLVHEVA